MTKDKKTWGTGYWEGEHPGKRTALYSMKFFILSLFLAILDPYPLVSVFRIRNMLVRIRVSGSGSGSCDLQIIFLIFVAYYFLKVYLHNSSRIKRSHITVEIKGFLTIFFLIMGGFRYGTYRYLYLTDLDPAPDQEHWLVRFQKFADRYQQYRYRTTSYKTVKHKIFSTYAF